jgi:adenylylsulfate kinase-like enzyme
MRSLKQPEIELQTGERSVEECVEQILKYM